MPFLETSAGALHYTVIDAAAPWEASARETIVFCHGVATNADMWSAWLPALVQRYRVVRFDTRGFGRSALPPTGFAWTLEALGDDILAVADAARAERFHLVGEHAHLDGRGTTPQWENKWLQNLLLPKLLKLNMATRGSISRFRAISDVAWAISANSSAVGSIFTVVSAKILTPSSRITRSGSES